jgi:hypothetical protein
VASLGDPAARDFLSHGTRTGKLSYLAASGRPLVAPVWFVVEDGSLVFNTNMGAGRAEEFGRRNGVPGELVVRVWPTKVRVNFDVSG